MATAKRQRTEESTPAVRSLHVGSLEGALGKLETMVDANEPATTRPEEKKAMTRMIHRIPDAIWAEILLATTTKESKRMRSTAKFLYRLQLIPDKRLVLDSRVWCSRGDVNIPQLLIDERKATLTHLQFEHTADAIQRIPSVQDCGRLTSLEINSMRAMHASWTRILLRTTGKRLQRLALRARHSASLPKLEDLAEMAPDLRFLAYVIKKGLSASSFSAIKSWPNLKELELGRVDNVTDAQWQALAAQITKCHTLRLELSWKQGERGTPDALGLLPPDLRELQWIEHGLPDDEPEDAKTKWAFPKEWATGRGRLEAFAFSRWKLTPKDANGILAQVVQWTNLTTFSLTGYLDKLNVDEYLEKFVGHLPRLSSFELHVIAPGQAPAAKTWAAFVADHKQLTQISGHVDLKSENDVALLTGFPFVELFLKASRAYIGVSKWLSSLTSLAALNVIVAPLERLDAEFVAQLPSSLKTFAVDPASGMVGENNGPSIWVPLARACPRLEAIFFPPSMHLDTGMVAAMFQLLPRLEIFDCYFTAQEAFFGETMRQLRAKGRSMYLPGATDIETRGDELMTRREFRLRTALA